MDSGSCDELWLEVEEKEGRLRKPGEGGNGPVDEKKEAGSLHEGLLKAEEGSPSPWIMGWQREDTELSKGLPGEIKSRPIFTLNSSHITQGGLFEIRCLSPREEAPFIETELPGYQPFVKTGDGLYTALIPTDYLSTPGSYDVICGYEGEERVFKVEIEPRDFHTQYLEIDEDIAEETRTDAAVVEFNQNYYAAITDDSYSPSVSSISQMDFMWPTVGIITTTYGEERYINGAATNVYHRGVDIAGDLGDAIFASADGRVNLAKNLISSGNTVIISHGLGVYTAYFHMDELRVRHGDIVKKGELIGLQGTTGFSNGVHLHFELSVRDVTMEPGYYILGREVDY